MLPVALTDYYQDSRVNPLSLGLTFAEAGPRELHYYPTGTVNTFKVGILVSGGIAPGINAVISGIVKRQSLHAEKGEYNLEILGYPEGFKPLFLRGERDTNCPDYEILASIRIDQNGRIIKKLLRDFAKYADEGGSILPSSRLMQLDAQADAIKRDAALGKIVAQLHIDNIDILYVIGGMVV